MIKTNALTVTPHRHAVRSAFLETATHLVSVLQHRELRQCGRSLSLLLRRQQTKSSRDLAPIASRDLSTIVRQIFAQIKSNARRSRKGPGTSSGPLSEISAERFAFYIQWTQAKWIVSRAEMVCRQTGRSGPCRCIDGTLVTVQLLALIGADWRCVDVGLVCWRTSDPHQFENHRISVARL